MSKHPDLDQILAKIKELQARLERLAVLLDQNQKEVNILLQLKEQLEDNLVELKRKHVVALAQDYKKAKEDLAKTKARLAFLRIDKETFLAAYNGNERMLKILRKDYADGLSRTQNNVIKGKFGKNNG